MQTTFWGFYHQVMQADHNIDDEYHQRLGLVFVQVHSTRRMLLKMKDKLCRGISYKLHITPSESNGRQPVSGPRA